MLITVSYKQIIQPSEKWTIIFREFKKGKNLDSVKLKTEIINGIIKVPDTYKNFQNAVVMMTLEEQKDTRKDPQTRLKDNIQSLDFSQSQITCFKDINPVDYQRKLRDDR